MMSCVASVCFSSLPREKLFPRTGRMLLSLSSQTRPSLPFEMGGAQGELIFHSVDNAIPTNFSDGSQTVEGRFDRYRDNVTYGW